MKQKLRAFGPEKIVIIKREVEKLLKASHVEKVQFLECYLMWSLSVRGQGSGGCASTFVTLTRSTQKTTVHCLRIDQLVDSTFRFEQLSMMDAYQEYHEIWIFAGDVPKSSFVTAYGAF